MSKARVAGQFLQKHEAEFQFRGTAYRRTIHPAGVVDLDGQDRDYYPSATEELVEHALRKLAADQRSGYHDRAEQSSSGVVFTLHMLREEMRKRGHERSYQQLVIALNILSGSIIEIAVTDGTRNAEGVSRSAYFPHLAAVSQTRLRDDPQAKWAIQFHPLVARSIDELTYRQFNYALMMSLKSQLARWLINLLNVKNTGAELGQRFQVKYSTIKRDSGLLEGYVRERKGIEALDEAFAELKEQGAIQRFERQVETGLRGKLEDITYVLYPSASFVSEAIAANKRRKANAVKTPMPLSAPRRQ